MSGDMVPPHVPAGKTRYKMTVRDPKQNPFRGQGLITTFKRADVDSTIPLAQVEQFARENAKESGFEFVSLEVIS